MRRTLSIFSIAMVIVLGTCSAVLERNYGNESPTAPDPASGRVNALNVHGRIVYLSDDEMHLKTGVRYGTLLFVVLGGGYGLRRTEKLLALKNNQFTFSGLGPNNSFNPNPHRGGLIQASELMRNSSANWQ